MFFNILSCTDAGISCSTFKESFHTIFPPMRTTARPRSFNISLEDILAAGLKVATTSKVEDHLTTVKEEVRILRCEEEEHLISLTHFDCNRLAIALDVQSLGAEVLASLHGLFGADHTFELAKAHRLIPTSERQQMLVNRAMRIYGKMMSTSPNVLATRIDNLDRLIKYRKSWHQSLKRDISRNIQGQHFIIWGSLFALIVGMCALI
ncbi:hypothetical protein BT69DRAFT_793434 [Atractiella rhizophila]|nr:hypothetical protein BT69DRAFT_793434 [Atractiella rhizophila]